MKLRTATGRQAQLIWYERPDITAPRPSDYRLIEVGDAESLLAALTSAIGIRGQVHKHRDVLLWRNVRIHLDRVQSLGDFVELEAVVSAADNEQVSFSRIESLRHSMGISDVSLIHVSYSDLLGI